MRQLIRPQKSSPSILNYEVESGEILQVRRIFEKSRDPYPEAVWKSDVVSQEPHH